MAGDEGQPALVAAERDAEEGRPEREREDDARGGDEPRRRGRDPGPRPRVARARRPARGVRGSDRHARTLSGDRETTMNVALRAREPQPDVGAAFRGLGTRAAAVGVRDRLDQREPEACPATARARGPAEALE